ncbi:Aerotaxis sensor receptor protein [hydrothermal vent metagenome]|uniref:Aerotaxis sensor receptor protein n=1 Tax=hydrothermal vent metagenome TaxID=652676 RepID=A0A1W1BRS0_9ZZZZ
MERSFKFFVETEVPRDELIISRTDLQGIITYTNETFADISGYEPHELLGKPHNTIRHPDMPKSIFADLWQTIKAGKSWSGCVKNLRKDGGYYWVHAEVSGVYKNGELVEYKSIREPISREKRLEMQDKYDLLRSKEENQSRVVLYIDNANLERAEALEKSR